MANTSETHPIRDRDKFYYRQRNKNRVFEKIVTAFAAEAERSGTTKKQIAERLKTDPAQITRWLSAPGNLTLDSISDLLLAVDSEMDYYVEQFVNRPTPNYSHPLMPLPEKKSGVQVDRSGSGKSAIALWLKETPNTPTTSSSAKNVVILEAKNV